MLINVLEDKKRVEIWVPYENRTDYKSAAEYYETVRKYRESGFMITVFLGGKEPLLPAVTALLEREQEGA